MGITTIQLVKIATHPSSQVSKAMLANHQLERHTLLLYLSIELHTIVVIHIYGSSALCPFSSFELPYPVISLLLLAIVKFGSIYTFIVRVHVLLAQPSVLSAWSMAMVLWLPFECYYYYYCTSFTTRPSSSSLSSSFSWSCT